MSNIKLLTLSIVMSLSITTAAMARDSINCSNARSQNREECVRAKANNQNSTVNCNNARSGNKDECARAKYNYNR